MFQHPTVEALLRELRRNARLRQVCGFEVIKGLKAVPNSWAFSRFLSRVMAHQDVIQQMFDTLVDGLTALLPDYGASLAMDGKALASYARGKRDESTANEDPGRRRDRDGERGAHEYRGTHEDGTPWQKIKKRFGYTIRPVVDSRYVLPVGFSVTRANSSEVVEAHRVLEWLEERHPEILERCRSSTFATAGRMGRARRWCRNWRTSSMTTAEWSAACA